MKVLLTGATGFIGSFLAEYLLKKKIEVRCLLRTSSNLRWIADLKVECHYGSLDDKESLKGALQGIDYVYHVAGITKALNNEEYHKVNVEGTQNLVETILEHKLKLKRFVFISSQAAAGPSDTIEAIDESHEACPVSVYGKSKLSAENYLTELKNKLPVTIIRPPVVYGPRDDDLLHYFKVVKTGILPKLDGREKYLSLIYVNDLVEGIYSASKSKKTAGQTYFIANAQPYSWEKIGQEILKSMDKQGFNLRVPSFLLNGAGMFIEGLSKISGSPSAVNRDKIAEMKQDFWVCSSRKANADFGFEAKTLLADGIRETVQWYKDRNWL